VELKIHAGKCAAVIYIVSENTRMAAGGDAPPVSGSGFDALDWWLGRLREDILNA
jgi:hypothetical protein